VLRRTCCAGSGAPKANSSGMRWLWPKLADISCTARLLGSVGRCGDIWHTALTAITETTLQGNSCHRCRSCDDRRPGRPARGAGRDPLAAQARGDRRRLPPAPALWRHDAEQGRAHARAGDAGTRRADGAFQLSRVRERGDLRRGSRELDDAIAVVAWARAQWSCDSLWLAGSLSVSSVALQAAPIVRPLALVTVAPPGRSHPRARHSAPAVPVAGRAGRPGRARGFRHRQVVGRGLRRSARATRVRGCRALLPRPAR